MTNTLPRSVSTQEARPSAEPRGPRLTDGVFVGDLINLDTRMVSARVFSDQELYDLEMEHIFTRSWLPVAHESEIPNPGDFVNRYIGEDPVIVVRGRDGEVNVMLNACTHRGMSVCRPDQGNAKFFRCPYHAWTYDTTGKLVGVPAEKELYDDCLDKTTLGLVTARVGTFAGMIFANWSDDAPPLEEDLADIRWYLDIAFNRSKSGLEVLGPPQRWTFNANWKLCTDQFAGDAYHAMVLHKSATEMGWFSSDPGVVLAGANIGSPRGHTLRLLDMDAYFKAMGVSMTLEQMPPPGMTPELVADLPEVLSAEQIQSLTSLPPGVGIIFPSVAWLNLTLPSPGGDLAGIVTLRTWWPRGPRQMEFVSWNFVERDVPDEVKQATLRNTLQTFSASGVFEQDDSEAWSSIQRATSGPIGRRLTMKYIATLGEPNTPDMPGLVWRGPSRDDTQWVFWKRYREMLTGADR